MQARERRHGQDPRHAAARSHLPHLPLSSSPGRAVRTPRSSKGAGAGPCPTRPAPPLQLRVPPATAARSTQNIKSQPQERPSSSRSASPRQLSPARGSHGYHHEKKGFLLWKLCV